MDWKKILTILSALVIISLLFFYLSPFNVSEFIAKKSENTNFSLNSSDSMQFYPNMRFPDSAISYKINDCPLEKRNEMENAFEIISNKTVLNFYIAKSDEEISIICKEKTRTEGGLFIAGEGGPIKVMQGEKFNVIMQGEILLLRESKCKNPNIAIHELFHVLGFNHSLNSANIMYYVSDCGQTIGDDQIKLINNLYSVLSHADLTFKDASAVLHGRFMDVNMTIKNSGLKDSEKAIVEIYADDELVKEIDFDKLEIGYERIITLGNIFVTKINPEKIELFINAGFNELEKNNNKIKLEIKK